MRQDKRPRRLDLNGARPKANQPFNTFAAAIQFSSEQALVEVFKVLHGRLGSYAFAARGERVNLTHYG